MKRLGLFIFLCVFGIRTQHAAAASGEVILTSGWHVTQDVRELGEQAGWYKPDYKADWQALERLDYLQLLMATQPYFGRNLRYFNDYPWWYRVEFSTSDVATEATLRFEGVDYFAKIWLNGTLLGEHEGYADPFGFEVGHLLRKDTHNVLVIKVSSPWDHQYASATDPVFWVIRNLLKGSYEHADTFVQRDVNPVGIWRPVKLVLHDELREADLPAVTTFLSPDERSTSVKVRWTVFNDGPPANVDYIVRVRLQDDKDAVTNSHSLRLQHGENTLEQSAVIATPKLWTTWDHGSQPLYETSVEVVQSGASKLRSSATFGVRQVELHRTDSETRFFMNGKPIYLRGTTYWPDLYLSKMNRQRYERDIRAAKQAGMNAFRIHVHTENPEFYEICDRLGMVVIQDNDLNWVFPSDEKFRARAVQHFGTLVKLLRNHPSVIAWIAMNEVFWGEKGFEALKKNDAKTLGSKLIAQASQLDPTRPVIENSGISNDLASGDIHDYRGSLSGGNSTYFDIFGHPGDMLGTPPKLVTEFGVDAPPAMSSLRAIPEAAARLSDVLPRVGELHDYQYRLLKYYVEYYRIHKYSPTAGHFQFMWIDFSPQSFYGVYDYWGLPKAEGLGGGLRALQESNQPVGIFMEHTTKPLALYTVNDSPTVLGRCVAHWRVTTSAAVIAEDSQPIQVGPDSKQKIRDFSFPVKEGETYKIVLELSGPDGKTLAQNTYLNPFQIQPRPQGYPERMDEELGMRLWWAGQGN
jgi:beta-mannosidase